MRDHVVQLAGDARPLPASHVLDQGVGNALPGLAVHQRLAARPLRDPGQGGRRGQRRQQHGQDAFLGIRAPGGDGSGQRQHQERRGQGQRQELGRTPRGLGSPATAPCCAAAAQPVQGDQQRGQTRDRQRLEGRERKHARRTDSYGGRDRPEESQRHRGACGERAHADQADHAHPGAGAPHDRLGHRRQPEQGAGDGGRMRGRGEPPALFRPSAAPVTCRRVHVNHCRRSAWV